MYTIFLTINCVKQLTFFKTFVGQLQFEQSLIFCLKVKLLENNFYYTYGRWFLIFNQLSLFFNVCSNCFEQLYFCVDHFFELLQFEQLNISQIKSFDKFFILFSHVTFIYKMNETFSLFKFYDFGILLNNCEIYLLSKAN